MALRALRRKKKQKGVGSVIGMACNTLPNYPLPNIDRQIQYCFGAINRRGGTILEVIEQPTELLWLTDKEGMVALYQAVMGRLDCIFIKGFIHEQTPMNHPVILQVIFPRGLSLKVYSDHWWDFYGGDSHEMQKMENTLDSIANSVRRKEHLQVAYRSLTRARKHRSQ